MQNEPIAVTLKVTSLFERLGVPYLIGGSLASTLYGMVRTTQDADLVAEMQTWPTCTNGRALCKSAICWSKLWKKRTNRSSHA